MSVASSLAEVKERVAEACRKANRPVDSVTLVAVSKTHQPEMIREAYGAGQRDFGENYAQELRDKIRDLADLPEIRWHAIGHLQTNKVRYVAGKALLHTLDRIALARELVRRAEGEKVEVLIEVNIASEPQKRGVLPTDLEATLASLQGIDGLSVVGLMCIPPRVDEPEDSRGWFRLLRELRDRLLPEGALSMGMSRDFEVAIEEGATLIRVGTAIFGERPPS